MYQCGYCIRRGYGWHGARIGGRVVVHGGCRGGRHTHGGGGGGHKGGGGGHKVVAAASTHANDENRDMA